MRTAIVKPAVGIALGLGLWIAPQARTAAPASPPFASTSFWNAPLPDDLPLDPDSKAIAQTVVEYVRADQQARRGPWINTSRYSAPVYIVGPDQPRVRVLMGDEPYKKPLQKAMDAGGGVPIPADAQPAAGTDAHMVVWQPSADTLWEFWAMKRNPVGVWTARWGGKMERVSQSPGYYRDIKNPDGTVREQAGWGSTACSLPMIGGLMMIQEPQAGRIEHAIQIMFPDTRAGAFSWPAQRTDGRSQDPASIPEGARFRLDPKLDLSKLKLHPVTRMIAEAAQKYGLVVNDVTHHGVGFRAEDPTPLVRAGQPSPYKALFQDKYPTDFLAQFPWEHLQLLRMELYRQGQTHP